ncbi:hypothetical protein J3998_02480 [Thiomicrorhabdus sp. 6S2-11]|uniref:Spermidine export protein MdtJ n=1 Tax=Thiomicrorhabdus marina TaxID=2818442 RepID=A0ABS3Q273_9GAMM|nr:SMR family transporter [Thiomicrorhabdus marina]MBO1926428.1 hypothetical protein [Thiomicrorhabdus marina]
MHWVFLLLAVIGEVAGTTAMKVLVSYGHQVAGTLVAIGMIGVSYLLLSQATTKIPVALANAFWEGFGMILVAIVSILILNEHISILQTVALLLAITGIVITHYGHHLQEAKSK